MRGFKGIRVLLPEWKVLMVRSPKKLPVDEVVFRIQPNMNKVELRSYLTQIYGVGVEKVNTKNVLGRKVRSRLAGGVTGPEYRKPSYKLAYVKLTEPFVMPKLFERS